MTKALCFSTLIGGKVDREKGIIFGVSVITVGEAKGHGVRIDQKTLETVKEVASEFSGGVKVKMRHKHDGEHQNVIGDSAGTLKNFSIDGNKVRADFHVFKSLDAAVKEKIFEMAETIPDQFGFSIAFSGVMEKRGEENYARCQELQSIDLSDNPAANPTGLFAAKDHESDCKCDACMDKKMSDKNKEKSMSSLPLIAKSLGLAETSTEAEVLTALTAKLDAKTAPVGVLTFKLDGKEQTLSGEQISAALSEARQVALDAKKRGDDTERNTIIAQMDREGRVAFNPETGVAYKLDELKTLDLTVLKFAAKNSPSLPMEARAVYRGEGQPQVDPALKGTAKIVADWSRKYNNLDAMRAQFSN